MAKERGYVMVATTVFATVLLAFLGLATDVGYLQWQKTRVQTAADAAAAGAGLQLLEGGSDANIVSEGQTDAALNGFTNGASRTTVTVNHPPLQGSQAGNKKAVEVIVERTLPTYFMAVIGSPSAGVTARAVTVLGNSGASGCVNTMNPSASKAFQVTGSVTVDFYCGIQVASSSASALFVGGTSIVYDNRSVGGRGWSDPRRQRGDSKLLRAAHHTPKDQRADRSLELRYGPLGGGTGAREHGCGYLR